MSQKWLGWQGSNLRIRESKPRALPLGDTPTQGTAPPLKKRKNGKAARIFAGAAIKKNGVGSGIRTHGLQSHNLAR